MNNRKLGAALLSAAAASIVLAAPVAAAPQPAPPIDFGSLTGPQSPQDNPGAPNSRNGVNSIQLTVGKWFGSQHGPNLYDTKFAPNVKWSARDRANAEVKGSDCQIEISFPGTSYATKKTANCQGSIGFNSNRYKTPGSYRINIVDRVSGASASQAFRIE